MRIASAIVVLLVASGCSSSSSSETGPHATVQLKDGTSVSGTVASSSASEIRITGDDNVTHAIPMSQVRSVDYGDAAATPAPDAAAKPGGAAPTMAAAAPRPRPASRPALPRPTAADVTTETHVIDAGTEISVQTDETIDGSTASEGQTFAADVTEAVRDAQGKVVIPQGAKAQVIIKSLAKAGKIQGQADLVLDLASVSIDGRQYALSTVDLEEKGRAGLGKNKRTAEFVGGGAAIGGVVGALLGGGKGAAIGAGIGAGGGTAAQAVTKGNIRVEAET
ncbi:MAG TPA: hypothetical protein VKB36_12640, partial [Vicinamibacterales bacterium]|nr:hypothetical protein [Vicinamibacterales bacterium]